MRRECAPRPLPPQRVEQLLDLARRAPSAGWSQGQAFVVVTDESARHAVAEAAGEADHVARGLPPWLSSAPVHVVPCADTRAYRHRYDAPDKRGGPEGWDVPYWWLDLGAAVQNLLLLATEAGLAAGFLGEHAVTDLAGLLGLPVGVLPAGVVTLGWPVGGQDPPTTSERRGRRALADVVHHGTWHEPAGGSGG
jgi:nitroreductase